jgi:hypothetical protein
MTNLTGLTSTYHGLSLMPLKIPPPPKKKAVGNSVVVGKHIDENTAEFELWKKTQPDQLKFQWGIFTPLSVG